MFEKIKNSIKNKFWMITTTALAITALPTAAFATTDNSIDFSASGTLDVTPADALKTGFNFMNQFKTWEVLVFGLLIAPVIVGFVIWILKKIPKFSGGKG